ncbi:MAG: ParB N-terminal domain-containing protein [Lachnospiraceae bacterium]|nr:ParB N-terminal domain-containing protein [Lachnospiraceae bacterium]
MQNYQELDIYEVELDEDNPRIANYLQIYQRETITSDTLALLLGTKSDSCASLRESIRENKGIIHPIIVNHTADGRYIVIEGNTRLQIYREFYQEKVAGDWSKIKAVVHEQLDDENMHAIRLQAHLVGPRDWDAYSKAKYLHYLSVECSMPMSTLVSYCGGSSKASDIKYMIQAYSDMEEYYRPLCEDASQFRTDKFHGFVEVQRKKDSLFLHQYTMTDFSHWMLEGKFDALADVRSLPSILDSDKARKVFLKDGSKCAKKVLAAEELSANKLKDVSYDVLAKELMRKMEDLSVTELQFLSYDAEYEKKYDSLVDVYKSIQLVIEMVDNMKESR